MLTTEQAEVLDLLAVCVTVFLCVDSGCVDVGVSEDVGKSYYVFLGAVICAGKQVTQIMGKNLGLCYPCIAAQLLHITPNI